MEYSQDDYLMISGIQPMCLEEMFLTQIPEGALYYGETRRREVVEFTEEIRNQVKSIFEEMHGYYERKYTPKVKTTKACSDCSLKDICLPKLMKTGSVKAYVSKMLEDT